MNNTKKEIENLKTENAGLKIRLKRIETFLLSIPNSDDYFHDTDSYDDLFEQAKEVVSKYDMASASLLQRSLMTGYARAARLLDELEEAGIVGPGVGAKPREVLINKSKKTK